MRAILINDTSAWYHFGCFLTSTGLKQLINETYELVDSVPIHELLSLQLHVQSEACLSAAARDRFVNDNSWLFSRIRAADVAIVNGEGSIHGDSPFVWLLFSVIAAAKLVLKKQVFIVNHSVFPDDGQRYAGRTTDALYRRVYQLADYVAVRDRRSSAVLRDLGIPGVDSFDCSVIAVTPKRVSRDRRIVVGASAAYANVEAFLGIFRQLSREGWDCRFIFGAPARPARDDQRFMSEMAVLGGGLPFKEVADADEFVGEIQRSALLVSGRFHYTIVAHCLGTPYVVLGANTPKNDALCAALGSPPPIPWTAADLRGRIMQAVAARIEPAGEPSLARLRALARRNLP